MLEPTSERRDALLKVGDDVRGVAEELGEFRLWTATANRAVELSGVPRDEVCLTLSSHVAHAVSLTPVLCPSGLGEGAAALQALHSYLLQEWLLQEAHVHS